jgi:hypothetical protein
MMIALYQLKLHTMKLYAEVIGMVTVASRFSKGSSQKEKKDNYKSFCASKT